MNNLLVIVSCGSRKIWNQYPNAGPTPARNAYTSSVFKVSRRYAEKFATRWLILSAKYGLIEPDFMIPGNYNRSFYDADAITVEQMRIQVATARLADCDTVAVLGSDAYWNRVVKSFEDTGKVIRHVNGNIGFPPLFQRLIGGLIRNNTPFASK